jgi:hypothetical protein
LAGLAALFAMGPAGATNVPPPPVCPPLAVKVGTNLETGHYYEVYAAPAITWDAARTCVVGKSYQGIPGHLATITSSSEDEWVDNLRQATLDAGKIAKGQVWIGGSQQGSATAPGIGWRWENGEGPIPGANNETAFANWANGEPNDGGDRIETGQEQHLTLGRFAGVRGWNDEGVAPASIGGFIVEYDVPRLATDCTLAGGCETVRGQTLTLPPGWVAADDTIEFTAYEFTDPRRVCGQGELVLFAEPDADDGKPELRIPPYLCGSPRFVVVAVNVDDSADLSFDRGGTVLIKNDTATVLPGNDADVVCKDTKGPIFLTPGEDPQRQDVVVYQTTDPGRMLEDLPGNRGRDPQFAGAAGEFTNSCGSSRGTGKELSYFVVGMRIDFGASAPTQEARHERFVALTLYKLSLLQQSVSLAKSAGALKNGDATKMTAQLNNAVKKLGRGDPSGALGHVNQFLKFVAAARYTQLGLDNNYNGEHLMRGTNIEFTLRVKVIPYAP